MAIFTLPKSIAEITEPQLLDEGYYVMRIVAEPELKFNQAKTKTNLVIDLRVQSDNPLINGRAFRKYLPWPSAEDADEADQFTGQPLLDKKMELIVGWAEAFAGMEPGLLDGNEVDLQSGQEAFVPVVQCESSREGHEGEMINEIPFEALPKAL